MKGETMSPRHWDISISATFFLILFHDTVLLSLLSSYAVLTNNVTVPNHREDIHHYVTLNKDVICQYQLLILSPARVLIKQSFKDI